jgi:hypothetical protein
MKVNDTAKRQLSVLRHVTGKHTFSLLSEIFRWALGWVGCYRNGYCEGHCLGMMSFWNYISIYRDYHIQSIMYRPFY